MDLTQLTNEELEQLLDKTLNEVEARKEKEKENELDRLKASKTVKNYVEKCKKIMDQAQKLCKPFTVTYNIPVKFTVNTTCSHILYSLFCVNVKAKIENTPELNRMQRELPLP